MSRPSSDATDAAREVSTLYLFPTEGEAAGLRRRPERPGDRLSVPPGKAAAGTVRALRVWRPRRAVLCGIAGACDAKLHAGDVVEIVEDSVAALPAAYRLSYLTPRRTSLPAARAVTVNVVGEAVASLSEPQMENYGTALPVVEQMEGAAVAAVCRALETEYMHLFTADGWTGTPKECDEGELAWIKKSELLRLRLWEGDKIFLRLLDTDEPFFSLKLKYEGDTLVLAQLNGAPLEVGR